MTSNADISKQIESSLNLQHKPVAIAFSNELADEIENFEGSVPAGCSFWELATKKLFATTANDHALCSIGIHTHNLADAPVSQGDELKTALEAMTGLDYVREAEIAQIPVMSTQHRYTIYGPLEDFPVECDVVILFVNSQQGLCITEAVARVDGLTPPAMGRPACAVIPQVANSANAAMSLGCCGARSYIDTLDNDVALWALPGNKLANYADQLEVMSKANAFLTQFHDSRKSDVAEGKRPSVAETLEGFS